MSEEKKFSVPFIEKEKVHSLSDEELVALREEFNLLRSKAESGEDLSLEEQRVVISWMRADRETKFILASKPAKAEKVPKEAKPKKLKKLTKSAYFDLLRKELKGEEVTEEEKKQMDEYLDKINLKAGG